MIEKNDEKKVEIQKEIEQLDQKIVPAIGGGEVPNLGEWGCL